MATHVERYAEGKFANPPHPKDGYSLPECMDPRARWVLEFLVPILYSEKLARVTVTMGIQSLEPTPESGKWTRR